MSTEQEINSPMPAKKELLPSGWLSTTLGETIELKYGKALPAKTRDNAGFPVFGSNGAVGKHSVPHLQGPVLVVGRKGSIGEVHHCVGPCSPIDTTYFVDEFYEQPVRYWYHMLKSLPLKELDRATALPGLNRNDAYDIQILVPPLAEQTRIVSKIESLQAHSSKTRALLAEVKPLIAQLRQSVLRSAFNGSLTADWRAKQHEASSNGSTQSGDAKHETASELLQRIRVERRERWEAAQLAAFEAKGKEPSKGWRGKYKEPEPVNEMGLPELPEGWCWATIDQLTYDGPQNGLYVPKTQYGSGIPILRIDDYQINWYRPNSELQRVNIDEETARTYGLKRSNLVVNRVNSPSHLGKSIVLDEENLPAVFESNMMRLELSSDREARYVHTFLTSDLGKSLLTGNAKWAVNQASINQSDVCRTPIPLAPPREQEILLKQAESAITALTKVDNQLSSMIATLTQLDQSILSTAFRGELVPQDPNDEPASELLSRIRASRAATDTKKKPSKKTATSVTKLKTK